MIKDKNGIEWKNNNGLLIKKTNCFYFNSETKTMQTKKIMDEIKYKKSSSYPVNS